MTEEMVAEEEPLPVPVSAAVVGVALPADSPTDIRDEALAGTTPLGSLEEDLPDLARSMEQSERLEEAMMAEHVVPVAAQVDVAEPAVGRPQRSAPRSRPARTPRRQNLNG